MHGFLIIDRGGCLSQAICAGPDPGADGKPLA
jgi:hypothetical protein